MKTQTIEVNTQAVNIQPKSIDHKASRSADSLVQKIAGAALRLAMRTVGVAVLLFCACNGTLFAQGPALLLYAETPGQLFTTSGNWTPITGLTLTLPPLTPGAPPSAALITLNLPDPYATGTNYPGGYFGISVNGAVLTTIACFTTDTQVPQAGNTGRRPTTLVVRVNLLPSSSQTIQAVWANVRGSTVIMDTTSTLSAVIAPLH